MVSIDCAILGAGPYGLSVAAHLRAIKGLGVRVFGSPMSFWEEQMPTGMLLRSPYVASNLSDPTGELNLDAYHKERGEHPDAPVPLEKFISYGRWFQRKAVPDLDTRLIQKVFRDNGDFRLILQDGESLKARRVVIATGIGPFAARPKELEHLPTDLVSHSSDHRDLRRFAGKEVLVIGGGQSALESAALMREAGAKVEVLVRESGVHWVWQRPWMHDKPLGPILYAPPDVGPAGVSQLTARPNLYRLLPRSWQDRLGARSVRPAGAAWLKPRIKGILISTERWVKSLVATNGRLHVKLNNGNERIVDHILLGTGYRIDISRYPFLGLELLRSIRQVNGYPQLDIGFACSVPGLHFVGATAAWSFGPLMRFVAGAEFASRSLVRRLQGNC